MYQNSTIINKPLITPKPYVNQSKYPQNNRSLCTFVSNIYTFLSFAIRVFFSTTEDLIDGLNYAPHTQPQHSATSTTHKYIHHPFITIPPIELTIIDLFEKPLCKSCGAQ